MPFAFSENYGMFDVTPVENLFIEEYLPRAPGEYIKIYLYGLRYCYHSKGQPDVEGFARALNTDADVVLSAFSYWEKQGIVRRVSDKPPTFEYINLKALLLRGSSLEDEGMYRLRSFNNALQGIFGARLLTPGEYTLAAEWLEEMKMSQEAILLMVRQAVAARGAKVSFKYLDKMAATWAQQGINTQEAAQAYLREQGSAFDGARQVLRALGLKRSPTMPEERLYQKWMGEWGFSQAAIELAMQETTKSAQPSFAYLDKVLQGLHERGLTDADELLSARQDQQRRTDAVREIMTLLGSGGGVTEDLRALYAGFLERGFDAEAIQLAAKYAKRRGGRSMQDVAEWLDRFAAQGLMRGAQIEGAMAEAAKEREEARALKGRASGDGAVTTADVSCYRRMLATGLPADMLALAADYAKGAKEPMAFAARVAENWKKAGISTLEQAKAEHEARGGGTAKEGTAPRKVNPALSYKQREYTKQEWDSLAMDWDKLEEES